MSRATKPAPRAEDKLSFFRRATPSDRAAGANPLIHWSVEPTGDYMTDVERGKAIAEELAQFVLDAPTYGNMTMLGCMLVDMQRFGSLRHHGLLIGFGGVILKLAAVGASIVGADGPRLFGEKQRAELIAAADDQFLKRIEAYRAEVEAYNGSDEASDQKEPGKALGEELQTGALRIETNAAALEALRQVLKSDCIGDTLDMALVEAVAAYLEGKG